MENNNEKLTVEVNEEYMDMATEEQIKQEQYEDLMGILVPSVMLAGLFVFMLIVAMFYAHITRKSYVGGFE